MKTAIITTDTFLNHNTGVGHPERADRVSVIVDNLKKFKKQLIWKKPTKFDRKFLNITHNNKYVDMIESSFPQKGFSYLDGDTVISPGSKEATLDAVGSIVAAIDGIQNNEFQNAFCAVRPPGHHAEKSKAMGFCIYNNVAVGAQYLLNKYKFENTTEFGCIQKFSKNNHEYSTHYIGMADRVDILNKRFDFTKIKTYFEIGGGFGSNIHFLLTNFKNIKKVIYLDVVPNIYVGTEYLRYFYKENIKDYLSTRKSKELSFENNEKLEIICIPPWEIEKIKVEIDHFHNAASFVEMPENVVEKVRNAASMIQ